MNHLVPSCVFSDPQRCVCMHTHTCPKKQCWSACRAHADKCILSDSSPASAFWRGPQSHMALSHCPGMPLIAPFPHAESKTPPSIKKSLTQKLSNLSPLLLLLSSELVTLSQSPRTRAPGLAVLQHHFCHHAWWLHMLASQFLSSSDHSPPHLSHPLTGLLPRFFYHQKLCHSLNLYFKLWTCWSYF